MLNRLQQEELLLQEALAPLLKRVAVLVANGADIEQAFRDVGYYAEVERRVLQSVLVAAEQGTVGTMYTVSTSSFRKWYKASGLLGGKLSEAIRSPQTADEIRAQVARGLRINNNVVQLGRSIEAKSAADIPQVLKRLIAETRTGVTAGLTESVKVAQAYVESLSDVAPANATLKNAYRRVIAEAQNGKIAQSTIDNAVQRKLGYINQRIARTEMAQSFELARMAAYDADPEIVEFEWVLSPEHPEYDICDYYAEADLYGRGAGIYPLDAPVAVPAHPNCLCMTLPRRGSINPKGRASAKRGREYLNSLPEKARKRVMGGIDNKARAQAEMAKEVKPQAEMPKELLKPRQ